MCPLRHVLLAVRRHLHQLLPMLASICNMPRGIKKRRVGWSVCRDGAWIRGVSGWGHIRDCGWSRHGVGWQGKDQRHQILREISFSRQQCGRLEVREDIETKHARDEVKGQRVTFIEGGVPSTTKVNGRAHSLRLSLRRVARAHSPKSTTCSAG